jgi:hypothetical protein
MLKKPYSELNQKLNGRNIKMSFPTALDTSVTLPNPTANGYTNNPSHAGLHDAENVAIIAVETKLGSGASTATSGVLLCGTGAGTSAWNTTAPAGTIVGTTDSQTLTNKVLTAPTISTPTITGATSVSGLLTAAAGLTVSAGTVTLPTNAIAASELATNAITLGYAAASASQTGITTVTDLTDLTITVTVPTSGRRLFIHGHVDASGSTANLVELGIWEGATELQTTRMPLNGTGGWTTGVDVFYSSSTVTPGSHTYKLRMATAAGGGTCGTTVNATSPVQTPFILVELR